eukprot:1158314-Pelagomonas_calceolata.AAC.2
MVRWRHARFSSLTWSRRQSSSAGSATCAPNCEHTGEHDVAMRISPTGHVRWMRDCISAAWPGCAGNLAPWSARPACANTNMSQGGSCACFSLATAHRFCDLRVQVQADRGA